MLHPTIETKSLLPFSYIPHSPSYFQPRRIAGFTKVLIDVGFQDSAASCPRFHACPTTNRQFLSLDAWIVNALFQDCVDLIVCILDLSDPPLVFVENRYHCFLRKCPPLFSVCCFFDAVQCTVSVIALGNECLTSADDVGCFCIHGAAVGNQPIALDLICTEIARSGAFIEAAFFGQDDAWAILMFGDI
jgi:hypothetical protein